MLPSLFGTESEDETSDENKGEGANEEDGSCGETDDWFSLYWLKNVKLRGVSCGLKNVLSKAN